MRMVDVFDDSLKQKMHIVRKSVSDECAALRSLCADYGVQPTYRIIDYDADTKLFVFDNYLVIARMSLDIDNVQYVVVYASEDACKKYADIVSARGSSNGSLLEFDNTFGEYDSIWVRNKERDVRDAVVQFGWQSMRDKHVYIGINTGDMCLGYTNCNGKQAWQKIKVNDAYRGDEFESYRNIVVQRSLYRDGKSIGVICLNVGMIMLSCLYGVGYGRMLDLVHAGMVTDHIVDSRLNAAGCVQMVGRSINRRLGSFEEKTGIRGNLEEVLKSE